MTPTNQDDAAGSTRTVVHLLRHGEVHNPTGVLYGRLPDYHLSDLGVQMAERAAETLKDRDITHLVSSPLERAQETAAPSAKALGLDIVTDDRVIEAGNKFEGQHFGVGDGSLRKPSAWKYLYNPMRPSWGEPYKDVVVRMLAAMHDARIAAAGHEALIVSHQLPVWIVRSFLEGRRLFHDPRKRQCSLASLTTFSYDGDKVVSIAYSEPAADLVPVRATKKFTAGA
jgi:broad specificity phosphatase PhoE